MYTLTVEISNFGAVVLSIILLSLSMMAVILFKEITRLRRSIMFLSSVFTKLGIACEEINIKKAPISDRYLMIRSYVITVIQSVNDWFELHTQKQE